MSESGSKGSRGKQAATRRQVPGPLAIFNLQLLVAVVFLGVLTALIVVSWRRYGDQLLAGDRFQISPARIQVTALPDWIESDVVAQVLRDGSLDNASLLDPEITIQIAQSFQMHSWVEKVRRVSKHPDGRVLVELDYRRPVAMVEVEGGLLPVDREGVLLPPDDFSATAARRFARIAVGETRPLGQVGTPWGDPRVIGAARIAAAFGESWRELGLYRIEALPTSAANPSQGNPLFELYTRQHVRIRWGHAPDEETRGEALAAEKFARLFEYIQTSGPLDAVDGPAEVDLRDPKEISVVPRTAARRVLRESR